MPSQFANTITQIAGCESTATVPGIFKHICWQIRRAFNSFPVELQISSSKIVADRPTGVGALINCMGMYDFNNMSLIKRILRCVGGTFVDVGANIGAYTLVASEIPSANVVSIEPHPHAYKLLCNNVRLNSRSQVTCLNVAASNHEGVVTLTDGPELATNRVLPGARASENSVQVRSRTLDSICEQTGIVPTIVKIDVEGHEPWVLEGFRAHITSVYALAVENGERREIQEMLQPSGLQGPYYFHATTSTFSTHPQQRREDPVYFRSSLLGVSGLSPMKCTNT
jgi:FkbM family methyltransferase